MIGRRIPIVLLAAALALAGGVPASAIVVAISFDVHQDIPPPAPSPNDFHVEGLICSNSGVAPVVTMHDDAVFPQFTYSIVPAGLPDPCWFFFTANWSGAPVAYCTTLHLGLAFDVEGENVIFDLVGWWTLNGVPVGNIIGGLPNQGRTPMVGFRVQDVPPQPAGQFVRIVNGDVLPPAPPFPVPIPIEVRGMDVVALPPGGLVGQLGPNWLQEVRLGGLQQTLPWVPVNNRNGLPISPMNPLYMVPDSFFDVFLEVPQIGEPAPLFPITIPPGGFLLVRSQMAFMNNAGQMENQWYWEIHGAQPPEACCLSNGSCQMVPPATCMQMNGTPKGPGSVCLGDHNGNQIDDACESQPQTEACCLPGGGCVDLVPQQCLQQQGIPRGPGTSCAAVAPLILAHPVSQSVCEGSPVAFSVVACGGPPPSYQWQFNGSDLLGQTLPTLTIPAASPGQAGSYRCVVFNPSGSVTSNPAQLVVWRRGNCDLNHDSKCNGDDVQTFLDVLLGGNVNPQLVCEADMNRNGSTNAGDIPEFVNRLLGR